MISIRSCCRWAGFRLWAEAANTSEPFDAILGFSQGALTAATFVAHLQANDLPLPRAAILCGGFRIPFPIEAAPFWPPREPLRVPSLHVIGVRDTVVAPCRSEELVRDFADAETHTHELIGSPRAYAGHVLPWDGAFHDRVATLLHRVVP